MKMRIVHCLDRLEYNCYSYLDSPEYNSKSICFKLFTSQLNVNSCFSKVMSQLLSSA